MPIYAYKCSACGYAKDVLQKISDAPLTVCPNCGKDAFSKQVTAAGFQLKGSGWYVTDFRGNNSSSGGGSAGSSGSGSSSGSSGSSSDSSPGSSSGGESSSGGGSTTAAAHGCGPGCACAA